jgi:glycyl-tRNA synthetase beta chain
VGELLLELGSEELPARFVVPALEELERLFRQECEAQGLAFGAVRRLGTPRRLALVVSSVADGTPDVKRQVMGPSVKAAFDEVGQPRKPALGFAESVKKEVGQLLRVQTPKGEYLAAEVEEKGAPAAALLPGILSRVVKGLTFPKSMRWGDVEASYARPLHWILALLDEEVLPVIFADVRSGRTTFGHRFLAPQPIEVRRPAEYEEKLKAAHVVPDVAERRAVLQERLHALAASVGARLLPDEALLDQVVNLVELPCPVLGEFEARHLDLPPEVLVQEMKSHQRYFSLTDAAGTLLPRFIAVSNTPVKDVALSVAGYERVLRARLTDGRFFFDEDRKARLETRVARLERVVWNRDLDSTYAEKAARLGALAVRLAALTGREGLEANLRRAALLCKADLTCGMVGEFPELQGVMGREYARADGEAPEVALALFEHYLPRGAGDALPTADEGALLGLADRLDSLAGLFAAGKKPTGAADQFGLRRAALAVINVTLHRRYAYSLSAAIDAALEGLAPKLQGLKKKAPVPVKAQLLEFFAARLEAAWRETARSDLVQAVLAVGFDDLLEAKARLDGLVALAGRPDFATLAATFKRAASLVEKQARDVAPGPVDPALLREPAEKALWSAVEQVAGQARGHLERGDFAAGLGAAVAVKAPLDAFFDQVMVLSPEVALKENRVRLLRALTGLFSRVASFSLIQSDG